MISMNISKELKKFNEDMKNDIIDVIKKLEGKEILVGIPEEKNEAHPGSDGITNAALLYIHEKGSNARNIPARPVLVPSLEKERDYIGKMMGEALEIAVKGGAVDEKLNQIGMECQNIVRDGFESLRNDFAPLQQETIKRKGSSAPLIDTGELRKAITYVVKEG